MMEQEEMERKQKEKAEKEIRDGKVKIKQERQIDGSCDKTESESCTESSSATDKKCHKKLAKEFFVYTYVGNEKNMLKLVEMDTTPEADFDLESAFASMVEKSEVDSVATGPSVESDTFAGYVDTENNTGGEEETSGESAYHSAAETDGSIVELKVEKTPIVYHKVESDSDTNVKSSTLSTDKIYTSFEGGERMSICNGSECNIWSSETIELSSDSCEKKELTDATDRRQSVVVESIEMKDLTNKDGEGDVTQEKETVEKDEAEKSDGGHSADVEQKDTVQKDEAEKSGRGHSADVEQKDTVQKDEVEKSDTTDGGHSADVEQKDTVQKDEAEKSDATDGGHSADVEQKETVEKEDKETPNVQKDETDKQETLTVEHVEKEKENSTVEPVDGNSQEKSGEMTVSKCVEKEIENGTVASSDKQNDNDLALTDPAEDDSYGKVDTGLDVPGKGEVATDSTDLQTSKAEYKKAFGLQQRT